MSRRTSLNVAPAFALALAVSDLCGVHEETHLPELSRPLDE